MGRRLALLAAATLAAAAALTGCGLGEDSCRNVDVDVPAAVQDWVADNPEVEVETPGDNDAECVRTPSGRWADETDG